MEVLKICPSLVFSVFSMNTELVHADVFFSGRIVTLKGLHCKIVFSYVRSSFSREILSYIEICIFSCRAYDESDSILMGRCA